LLTTTQVEVQVIREEHIPLTVLTGFRVHALKVVLVHLNMIQINVEKEHQEHQMLIALIGFRVHALKVILVHLNMIKINVEKEHKEHQMLIALIGFRVHALKCSELINGHYDLRIEIRGNPIQEVIRRS